MLIALTDGGLQISDASNLEGGGSSVSFMRFVFDGYQLRSHLLTYTNMVLSLIRIKVPTPGLMENVFLHNLVVDLDL